MHLCDFQLEGDSELTPDEKESINDLWFSWDLPPVNSANRRWLYERPLHLLLIISCIIEYVMNKRTLTYIMQ